MFNAEYKRRWQDGRIAPLDSAWRRDNVYSRSQFLSMKHNFDIHADRVEHKGVLKVRFEQADELEGLNIDVNKEINDEVDECDYPSCLNFLPPDIFREILEQGVPDDDSICVTFPMQPDIQHIEDLCTVDRQQRFLANPPSPTIKFEKLTVVQRKAVQLGVDMNVKILYLSGKAGSGKTEVALHICEHFKGKVQTCAVSARAASNLAGTTVHGLFGWACDGYSNGEASKIALKDIQPLLDLYQDTEVFIVDEVNSMTADMLARLDESMTQLFNDKRLKNSDQDILPFGGKKVVFMGDNAQLPGVMGESIDDDGHNYLKADRVRGCRGRRQARYTRSARGQELYRKYLAPNCIMLGQGHRNSGKLQEICDRLRAGEQTEDDLRVLTFQRRRHPEYVPDVGIHYDNELCATLNIKELWAQCQSFDPPRRLYVCKASYHTTESNDRVVAALSAMSPTKFQFAPDVLCLAEGCQVRLIKNLNVAAGLVNSSNGTVQRVIYRNADVPAIREGKFPPPYAIIVSFRGFTGFPAPTDTDPSRREFPFPAHKDWVPIYRQNFIPKSRDVTSAIWKQQEISKSGRTQFPISLSRHITAHRSQGQTLANCTLSVDLDLQNPDKRMPDDLSAILYVALTRATELKNLYVSTIVPSIWEKIGQGTDDDDRRVRENKLKELSREFAAKHSFINELDLELNQKPNSMKAEDEWTALKNDVRPPESHINGLQNFQTVDDRDLTLQIDGAEFQFAFKPVSSQRDIGIDQGLRHFAIVCVDKFLNEPPKLVAAQMVDLNLPVGFSAADAFIALTQNTELWINMQQTGHNILQTVDRIVLHIEQMSLHNRGAKNFGINLGQQLQRAVRDNSQCVVKLSQAQKHLSSGPIFRLGKTIIEQLSLKPIECNRKRPPVQRLTIPTVNTAGTSQAQTQPIISPLRKKFKKRSNVLFDDVEPSDDSNHAQTSAQDTERNTGPEQPQHAPAEPAATDEPLKQQTGSKRADKRRLAQIEYRKKKKMSADIFRYFIFADEAKQADMGVNVDSAFQAEWRAKIADDPSFKLDDLGDALLHALNDIVCPMSQYRQMVPPNSALQSNRSVIISVQLDQTYFAVLHVTYNLTQLENFGVYPSDVCGRFFKDQSTVEAIKRTLDPELSIALKDVTGSNLYRPVDHIKVIVKQLKNYKDFTGEHAGTLTRATAAAMEQICDECAGSDSQLSQRKDAFGRLYIRTKISTGQKFQVILSNGKQTNAILSCINWMTENATSFLQKRTSQVDTDVKVKFFNALQDLACSQRNRFEMIELSEHAKQKLIDVSWKLEVHDHMMLADIILIGISKNQQVLKSIASNYRVTTPRFASTVPVVSSDIEDGPQDDSTSDTATGPGAQDDSTSHTVHSNNAEQDADTDR